MINIPKSLDQVHFQQQIGMGAFAKVYKIEYQGHVFALKQLDLEATEQIQAYQEMKILAKAKHANIVQLQSCFIDDKYVNIIEELAQCNLRHLLLQQQLTEPQMSYIVQQILYGLVYLHNDGVVHRDLKPHNVLITGDLIKICDFGVSAHITQTISKHFTNVGTTHYVSPEQYSQSGVTQASDLWALGILIVEMITQELPFKDLNHIELGLLMQAKKADYLPSLLQKHNISKSLREFLQIILHYDPKDRLTAQQLLEHRFLKIADKSGILEISQLVQSQLQLRALPYQQPLANQNKLLDFEWDFEEIYVNRLSLAFASVDISLPKMSESQAKSIVLQIALQEKQEVPKVETQLQSVLDAINRIK